MSNPYYGEDDVNGLKYVSGIELDDEDWQFYTAAVFYKDGKFYTGIDSGCSCPTPFEDFKSLSDYDGPFTKEHIIKEWIPSLNGSSSELQVRKMNLRSYIQKWKEGDTNEPEY